MDQTLNILITFISIVLLLAVVIGIHELGHFLAARKFGVHVIRFKIGFGKTLMSKFDKRGTEFSLGLLPLGGYVQMLGEENPLQGEEGKEDSLNKLTSYPEVSLGARAIITAAGPVANFLLAIFAFFLIFLIGTKDLAPVVGYVYEDSLAEEVGLEVGDRILSIDGKEISILSDLNEVLASRVGETGALNVQFLKEARTQELSGSVFIEDWLGSDLNQSIIRSFGISPFSIVEIFEVIPESSAEKSGLLKGDKIIGVGGNPIKSLVPFQEVISSMPETNTLLEVRREDQVYIIPIFIDSFENNLGVKTGLIGVKIIPSYDEKPQLIVSTKEGPFKAFYMAVEKTYKTSILILDFIGKMISGSVSSENIGGPIQIAQVAGSSAKAGLIPFISVVALISINLGILNLLPIPILDGGQLVLIAAEKLKGSPLSDVFVEYAHRIGLFFVVSLMIFAVFNDFVRLV